MDTGSVQTASVSPGCMKATRPSRVINAIWSPAEEEGRLNGWGMRRLAVGKDDTFASRDERGGGGQSGEWSAERY